MTRIRRHTLNFAASIAWLFALSTTNAFAQTGEENPPAQTGNQIATDPVQTPNATGGDQLLALVLDPNAEMDQRVDAATKLANSAIDDPDTAAMLGRTLLDINVAPESALLLTRAIAAQPVAPESLVGPLTDLAERLDDAQAAQVIPALGSIRSRGAARALHQYTSPDRSTAIRTRAFAALWRLTGQTDLGTDHDAWNRWLEHVLPLEQEQWSNLLIRNLARQRDELVGHRQADIERLVTVARRLNLATPPQNRSALLADYLLDPRVEMRNLGFDLVERELRQAAQLNGEVGDASIVLLSHPDPRARRRAAQLIDQIAPDNAGPALVAALAAEKDPIVAAELLTASVRWPSKLLQEPVVRWLSAGEPTFTPAVRSALELYRNQLLTEPGIIEQVATALRAAPIESLSDQSLMLLAAIGANPDRAKIAGLLASDQPQTSRAAAAALADRPEHLDQILLAARDHDHLLPIAIDCVIRHRPSASGYGSIAKLVEVKAGQPRVTAPLLRVAAALNVADLLEVALKETDLQVREQLLTRLADDSFNPLPDQVTSFASALVQLTQLQNTHGRSDAALITLAKVPQNSSIAPELLVRLRATALIATDRLDEARQLEPTANAWLDALESVLTNAPSASHAAAILEELNTAFEDSLSDAQRERLTKLAAAVSELVAAADDGTDPGDPGDPTQSDPPTPTAESETDPPR